MQTEFKMRQARSRITQYTDSEHTIAIYLKHQKKKKAEANISLHFEHSTLSPTQGTDTTGPNPASKASPLLMHSTLKKNDDDDDDSLAPSRSEGNLAKHKISTTMADIGT